MQAGLLQVPPPWPQQLCWPATPQLLPVQPRQPCAVLTQPLPQLKPLLRSSAAVWAAMGLCGLRCNVSLANVLLISSCAHVGSCYAHALLMFSPRSPYAFLMPCQCIPFSMALSLPCISLGLGCNALLLGGSDASWF